MTIPYLNRRTVLVLNRHWLAIDAITGMDAFGHLASGSARALRMDGNGIETYVWSDWRELALPVGAAVIGTPRGTVAIPTVIVLERYERVPLHTPAFGLSGLWERDDGRCQYSGRHLTLAEANIDHIIPRSRGGADSWENCVLADRLINSRKGARTPEEAGLRLLRRPFTPRAVPASMRIRNPWQIRDWDIFLKNHETDQSIAIQWNP